MNWIIALILCLTGNSDEGPALEVQLQYSPSILRKGSDFGANRMPYCRRYLDQAFSVKAGISTKNGWKIRATGGMNHSLVSISNPNYVITESEYSWNYLTNSGFSSWQGWFYHVGCEIGKGVWMGNRRGEIYLGLEGLDGNLAGEINLYTYITDPWEEIYRTDTANSEARGIAGYVGVSVPVASWKGLSIDGHALFRAGFLTETSSQVPQDATWQGPYSLPRTGIGLGLSMNFASKPVLKREQAPFSVPRDTVRKMRCCLKGVHIKPGYLQFLTGMSVPVIGYVIVPFVSPLIWTDDTMGLTEGAQYLWYYYLVPLWAGISASATGRAWKPDGEVLWTAAGALIGDVLSFALASVYCTLMGKDPWYAEINMDPTVWDREEQVFVLAFQPAATILPVVGAVIGYNLSLKHARESEDMGYKPTWTQQVAADIYLTTTQTTGTEIASFTVDF